jgi:hypothetical protein
MIVPENALERLLSVATSSDAPIVTGLYSLRHGDPVPNIFTKGVRNLGSNMNWHQVKEFWGQTIEVSGGCMGCLLVDRSVLKDFCFETGKSGAPDIAFMVHCAEKKFKTMAALDVVCGHATNTDVIWPDKDAPTGTRRERLN